MSRIGQFIAETRRRRVFRVAALYIIAAWVILQIADVLFPTWNIPDSAKQYVLIGALLGFPLALVFGWIYDITSQGIVRTPPAQPGLEIDLTLRRSDYLILSTFVLVAGAVTVGLVDRILETPVEQEIIAGERSISAKSIAVLPFENRSPDPENAYFADGMHDDLLSLLSRLGDLKVISRTSVQRYRNTDKTTPEIGRELGVAYVLEGAVQRMADQVHINVQLIAAEADEHIWAGMFDEELTAANIFAIQSGIAESIVNALQATLSPGERDRIETRPTENFAAYQSYLVGKQRLANRTSKDYEQAIEYFTEAIELDPGFALAYAGLADAYTVQNDYGYLTDEEYLAKAPGLIDQALSLDDSLGEAHVSLATLKHFQQDFDGAEAAFKRAIELNPNNAQAYQWYGVLLRFTSDRYEEALALYRKAVELDPLSPIMNSNVGSMLMDMGRFEEALEQRKRNIEINPDSPQSHGSAGTAYYWPFGQAAKAVASYRKFLALDPEFVVGWWRLGMVYLDLGDDTWARYWLGRFLEARPDDSWSNFSMGLANLRSGDQAQALEYFNNALTNDPDDAPALTQIRNFDIQAGQYAKARSRYVESFPELFAGAHPEFDGTNYDEAIDLAAVLLHTGEAELAASLLDGSHAYAESFPALRLHRWTALVEIYALQGRTQMALESLRKAIDDGDRWLSWYHFELNPNLKSLHDEPEFQAMADEVRIDMAAKLFRLKEMEAKGELAPLPYTD